MLDLVELGWFKIALFFWTGSILYVSRRSKTGTMAKVFVQSAKKIPLSSATRYLLKVFYDDYCTTVQHSTIQYCSHSYRLIFVHGILRMRTISELWSARIVINNLTWQDNSYTLSRNGPGAPPSNHILYVASSTPRFTDYSFLRRPQPAHNPNRT